MPTVIVSGVIANKYRNGGAVWTRLNWVLGLMQLGVDVYFVEQISRESCVDASGSVTAFEESVNLAYFKRIVAQFGLAQRAALIYDQAEQTYGLSYPELLDLAEDADLLVNITGHLTLEPLMQRIRRKAYIDLDPGYTQFWHIAGNAGPRLAGHDVYFTVGENIGTPVCSIPTGDIRWRPIRQPVVLEQWPVSTAGEPDRFTTIASWRGPYGSVQYGEQTFGLKVHEFRKFIEMPGRAPQTFEIALDIHPAEERDLAALAHHGWQIVDPAVAVPDPDTFRQYVQLSGAEFSVAQGIYVQTESGWFSDRTVRYLASGKPALVQDTGYSRNIPTGYGLVPFRTLEQAVAGTERIARDYQAHCRAARELAERYFAADKVVGQLLEEAEIAKEKHMFGGLSRWWRSITGTVEQGDSDPAGSQASTDQQLPAGRQATAQALSAVSVYEGSHDGASEKRIYGWAWDSAQPDTPVDIDIYVGSTLLATVPADRFRQDLLDAGRGDGRHGFEYPTPQELLDGKLHVIRVTFAGTETELSRTPRTIRFDAAAEVYKGVHEASDGNRISGWVWDITRPDEPIDVDIYDGDTLLETIRADKFRQSLLDRGRGNGAHGFSYKIPRHLKDGRPHTIKIVVAGTNIPLKGTPQTITISPE